MMILKNTIIDVSNRCGICCTQWLSVRRLFRCVKSDCQQSVDDSYSYTFDNHRAPFSPRSKLNVLVRVKAEKANNMLVAPSQNEHQRSIQDFLFYTFDNQWAALSPPAKVNLLLSIIGKKANDTLVAPSSKSVSTQRQQYLALHLGISKGYVATLTYNQTICRLARQKCFWQHRCFVLKMSITRVSTILGLASWKIQGLWSDINP